MLRPFDPVPMRRYALSTRVNHVLNDDADCAKPVELEVSPLQRVILPASGLMAYVAYVTCLHLAPMD